MNIWFEFFKFWFCRLVGWLNAKIYFISKKINNNLWEKKLRAHFCKFLLLEIPLFLLPKKTTHLFTASPHPHPSLPPSLPLRFCYFWVEKRVVFAPKFFLTTTFSSVLLRSLNSNPFWLIGFRRRIFNRFFVLSPFIENSFEQKNIKRMFSNIQRS